MGVNGLWTVIQPCARPTNLATLNRKRLAVDASIWIYQFLKAVRDKEGNALRNSHVVGFFRRICKLLWFGIRPVFVFDGGAPALKRQTITSRKRRREGRREDAVRTAGKLLAVQMQRIAEDEDAKRRRKTQLESESRPAVQEVEEEIPDADKLVYVDELGMDQKERMKSRRFYKQDAYHLPELQGSIEGMGRPEDPRIMNVEELEEYARQFHSGEDINLYDFSKIDFEGEFFKSLPPADRYNILNAARLRSRLRMGLTKEQLDIMFPDRMAFSRFQIERVKERNHLTQRLMQESGMTGTDLTLGVNARIAGERDREYILVKNDGAEGGWALGVVSKEKDRGEVHKPIDVDALDFQYQAKEEDQEWEDDDGFEDVPIEGLNRLPKIADPSSVENARKYAARREWLDDAGMENEFEDTAMDILEDDSLFVAQDPVNKMDDLFGSQDVNEELQNDEEEDINRAIALSLKKQHAPAVASATQEEDIEEEFEDVPGPEWTQKAVQQPRPVASKSGKAIAHIVNSRANAAIPKRRPSNGSSDSDVDLSAALSGAKKKKKFPGGNTQPALVLPNIKKPFGGPLPFEKLNWKSSIFAKKTTDRAPTADANKATSAEPQDDGELAGGFIQDAEDDEEARPLPPWMLPDESDIRDNVKAQQERENEINEEDREAALAETRRRQKEAIIEIESSDSGNESDIEFVEAPPPHRRKSPTPVENTEKSSQLSPATLSKVNPPVSSENEHSVRDTRLADNFPEASDFSLQQVVDEISTPKVSSKSSSPEPEFEEVEVLQPPDETIDQDTRPTESPEPAFEDISGPIPEVPEQPEANEPLPEGGDDVIFGDAEIDDEFSDPEEEELMAQMAEEAEEHARFASQLNNKSEKENRDAYERELKELRTQQKKDRRDADEVTQVMITECQALLRYFGIPYITAPMEAEAQCASLVSLGLVDGIVTDDSDIFLFGGTRVYKNMFNSNKFVECYLGSDLEKELSLSREQLISIAQLLGSDYTEGLPGVGPVTAVEILSEFPGQDGLANFREWWQDIQVHSRPKEADQASTFRRKFRKSQSTKLFLPPGFPNPAVFEAYLHPDVDANPEQFQWGVPDVEGLRRFLMATIGWSQERTDEVLVPVIRDMNRREAEGTQSNITRFFEGSVGVGAKEAFAPRQKVKGSKRMAEAVNKLRANAVADTLAPEATAAEDENLATAPSAGDSRKRKADDVAAEVDDNADHDDGVNDDGDDDFVDGSGDSDGVRETGRRKVKSKAVGRGKGKGKGRGKAKRVRAST